MQRDGQALIPHGTVQGYDPLTGTFTAFMDFQKPGETAYIFTPGAVITPPIYTDQNGLIWTLIR